LITDSQKSKLYFCMLGNMEKECPRCEYRYVTHFLDKISIHVNPGYMFFSD